MLALLVIFVWTTTSAQINPEQVRQFISDSNNIHKAGVKQLPGLLDFYARLGYQTAWIQKENSTNCNIFLAIIKQSAGYCLRESDYQSGFIEAFRSGYIPLKDLNDSLDAEIRITDAALHFYSDIAYGNEKPGFGYFGLDYTPSCSNIPGLLADHVSKNVLPLLINKASPSLVEIKAIEKKAKAFLVAMADTNFKEVKISSTKVNTANRPLVLKLYQLGILDSVYKQLPEKALKEKVQEAQHQFNLITDGILRSTIVAELNIPLSARLQQLNLSINYYRWLNCLIQHQQVVVVNIPGTVLKVYRANEVVLEMRMIVGKKSTPTPTLASTINEVILYPYWHVPYSIATKELLPAIRRDPGYIDAGNYQVLNKVGKIVDPYSVNWQELSSSYFPYIIRQSTGCDNALGLLKLNFYNPFGVYLHDTSNKSLFTLNKRFFSHGCMRMEKPMELGHLVLKNNRIAIDTLEQKGCLRNQSPIVVHADEHIPVIVWYNPVGINSAGQLLFYEDVYNKFDWWRK
ncbi:MAG: L,D-transpeptidase family protein [Chitinophagaceae bacterium]